MSEFSRFGLVWRTLRKKQGSPITIVKPDDVVDIVVLYGKEADEISKLLEDEEFTNQYVKSEGDSVRIVRIH